jgi:hypothetical protein
VRSRATCAEQTKNKNKKKSKKKLLRAGGYVLSKQKIKNKKKSSQSEWVRAQARHLRGAKTLSPVRTRSMKRLMSST